MWALLLGGLILEHVSTFSSLTLAASGQAEWGGMWTAMWREIFVLQHVVVTGFQLCPLC